MLLRLAIVLAVVYAGFAVLAWVAAERVIFQPPPPSYSPGPNMRMLRTADGGTIAARWLPYPEAHYTVLFSHGNGEDMGYTAAFLRAMRQAGFAVVAYDYRGYGLSPGRPGERRAYRDADAAYDFATRELGVPPERLILHGRSLGGAVAADLAARRPAAGLVLESTFTSAFRVAADVPLLPFDRFRSGRKLARVRAPVLVVHGTADEVVPFAHGRRLYELAPGPKRAYWVEGAGHNDLLQVAGERYWRELRAFAEGLAGARETPGDAAP